MIPPPLKLEFDLFILLRHFDIIVVSSESK